MTHSSTPLPIKRSSRSISAAIFLVAHVSGSVGMSRLSRRVPESTRKKAKGEFRHPEAPESGWNA